MRRILFVSLFFLVFPAALLFSQNGTPLPNDVYWDNSFGHPLPEGYTGYPGAAAKDGKFYISSGPVLYFHNGYQYYGYAEWDGKGWTYKGPTGSDRKAFEVMLPMGDSLLAGGDFQNLNGSGIDYLTLWDGTQFNAVGQALNGRVRAMQRLSNGDVIVGGEFTTYGATQADRLARWDGASWHIVTNGVGSYGVNGTVYSITGSDSGGMYIGGYFGNAGGLTGVNGIVHYNPTTLGFTALGSGFDSEVYNVVNGGGILRAGGVFYNSGATPTKFFAEDSAGGWVDRNFGLTVQAPWRGMYSTPSGVWYIAGSYYINTDSWGLLRYNGSGWDVVDSLFPGNFFFLTGDADTIYASVGTTKDATRDFRGIGRWNGTRWSGLGNPIGLFYETPGANSVNAIGYVNGTVYAAGYFYQAGDIRRNSGINLVMMTNQGWQEVGGHIMSGSNAGTVNHFGTMGTDLYAGGMFTDIGGTSMMNVGRWDGAAWHALGAGVNGTVHGLAVNGSDVFVVGEFDSAGAQVVNGVARWDGAAWHPLGNGVVIAPSYYPSAVVVSGTDVIVAGRFNAVDSNNVSALSGLAKWNGSQWSALPVPPSPGQYSAITALATIGNNLYVNFNTYYNGDYKGFVYQWDGSTWTQIGGEFENSVSALWANGTELYASGIFSGVDADTVWRIAKWNGSKWVGLGTGLANGYNGVIQGNCLLGTPDGLYVGGTFSQAGMYSSYDIALWKDFAYQSPVTALSTPVLTAPADDAIDQPLSPTLSWNAVAGATVYQVQVSTDSTFGTTMVNDSSLGSPSKGLAGLSNDTEYFWRVRAANTSGASWWSPVWSFRTIGGATAVNEQEALPKEFALGQNYPNPFNPSTTIEFAVPKQTYVELEVYDMLSRRVATLVHGVLSPGYHKATFDGRGLPSGIYFYRLRAGTVVITRKLMMIK